MSINNYCAVIGKDLYTMLSSTMPERIIPMSSIQEAIEDSQNIGVLVVALEKHIPQQELVAAKKTALKQVPTIVCTKTYHYLDVLARQVERNESSAAGKRPELATPLYLGVYKELVDLGIIVLHRSVNVEYLAGFVKPRLGME